MRAGELERARLSHWRFGEDDEEGAGLGCCCWAGLMLGCEAGSEAAHAGERGKGDGLRQAGPAEFRPRRKEV